MTLYLDARSASSTTCSCTSTKTSMAHSLEVRVPFLDHRLVEWAATRAVGDEGPSRRDETCPEACGRARLLPAETVHKRKVGFFRFALEVWLDAQLDGTGRPSGSAPPTPRTASFSTRSRRAARRDYRREPTEDRSRLLFAILLLESWLTSFSRRALEAAATTH